MTKLLIDRLLRIGKNTAVDINPQSTLFMLFNSLQYVYNCLDLVHFLVLWYTFQCSFSWSLNYRNTISVYIFYKKLLYNRIWQVCVILITALAGAENFCSSDEYSTLGDLSKRSPFYVQDAVPLCDRYLSFGWYRAGFHQIPTTPPELLSCGTLYPYWMSGEYSSLNISSSSSTLIHIQVKQLFKLRISIPESIIYPVTVRCHH